MAAAGSQNSRADLDGYLPLDTLQGSSLYIRPSANNQSLLVGESARASGTPTNFAQATCSGTVYGLDVVLSPPA